MQVRRYKLTLAILLLFAASFTISSCGEKPPGGFPPESIMPEGIVVDAYDPAIDYMALMEECVKDGSPYALKLGAIYEQQRNLKIQLGMYDQKETYCFDSYDSQKIKESLESEN